MHYVIGDIHGCYDEMITLVNKIESQDAHAIIYFIGDFIDRGPKVWETLQWMLTHITSDGKYRAVRGNHEQMVCDYYESVSNSWNDSTTELPAIQYGFDKVLKAHNCFSKEYLSKVVQFFSALPLSAELEITSVGKVTESFMIAHAFTPTTKELEQLSAKKIEEIYLWSREHYWGYPSSAGKILIHGHTPTTDFDYLLRNPNARPGMIAYSSNSINVDGGCCYSQSYIGNTAPCMLCGICLETLEEFYCSSVEERFISYLQTTNDKLLEFLSPDEAGNILTENYWNEYRNHLSGNKVDYYRVKLLERLGLPNKNTTVAN